MTFRHHTTPTNGQAPSPRLQSLPGAGNTLTDPPWCPLSCQRNDQWIKQRKTTKHRKKWFGEKMEKCQNWNRAAPPVPLKQIKNLPKTSKTPFDSTRPSTGLPAQSRTIPLKSWRTVKKKTPTGKKSGWVYWFLLPIGFLGYPVFLTYTHVSFSSRI